MSDAPFFEPAAGKAYAGRRRPADKAALLGLAAGFAMLSVAIGLGGHARSFVDVPSLLIVVGGTLAIVTMCFSFTDVATMLRVVASMLIHSAPDPSGAAMRILYLADEARRHGVLHLEFVLGEHAGFPFLQKALSMVIDGAREEEVEDVLRHDVQATPHRLRRSAAVLRRGADYAPAMGLIGTLIGLVQMLGQLSQPQHIGPSMAVALLTTLYGAVLANMILSPLAVKLDRNAADEELICRVYLMGAMSICRQENPRRLELLLNSMLPPAKRVRHFE
ncbi:MAG: MotA/TolQ/ExbB proton channel family protein [Rhodospirillales bacterium]|nr:MotA/TolQ/ExbB proton channel family protein [Rhodospirillales bacterium]